MVYVIMEILNYLDLALFMLLNFSNDYNDPYR